MHLPVRLPLLGWLLAISLLNLLLISSVVYFNLNKAENILHDAWQARIQAVRNELRHALEKTISQLNHNTDRLATWEEVLAQFHDPSYYFFWVENSLPGSNLWTPVNRDIQLYIPNGDPLVKPKRPYKKLLPQHLLPETLTTTPFARVASDKALNRLYYQRFVPVYDAHNQLIGWLGVAYDVLAAMRFYYPFQYLSVSQLHVTTSGEFPIDKLENLIDIQHQPDTLGTALLAQIHNHAYTYIALLLGLFLVNTALTWWLYYRPLRQIHHALESGQPEQTLKDVTPAPVAELNAFHAALQSAHAQQRKAIEQLRHSRDELQTLALIDPVTGLYNRTALHIHLEGERAPEGLKKPPVAFVLMDIAHFRALNDTYGPIIGDAVLEEIAHVLRAHEDIRASYRLGGDEFVMLFSGLSAEMLNLKLHTLADTIEHLDLSAYDMSFPLHVRFGVVTRSNVEHCKLHHCLAEADAALMLAKQQNQTVQFFQESLRQQCMLLNTETLNSIRRAVFEGEGLVLYRQPIIKPDAPIILYHELLARVEHEGRLIHPAELFQVIDRHHWHIPFDRQVVAQARQLLLSGNIPERQGISINLSGQTLMGEDIVELLAPLHPWLATHTLVIEVLETYLIDRKDVVRKKLDQLRAQGFKVALDDFGSGHASIAYLADLPVDIIKLDRSLTLRLGETGSRQAETIRSIIQLVHRLGYNIILEGIEEQSLCERINNLPIDGYQGFLFSRPQPHTVSEDDIYNPCSDPTSSH